MKFMVNNFYIKELELRNNLDKLQWLVENKKTDLTVYQFENLKSMVNSKDSESKELAIEIINLKTQE